MHHRQPPHSGAPNGPPGSRFLYVAKDGRAIALQQWHQLKSTYPGIRECEALLLMLAERMPYPQQTDHRQILNQLLRDQLMDRTLVALRQLPDNLRPVPMNRLRVLSFALRFSARFVRVPL